MRPHGRARVNISEPSAFGICERDGFQYNLRDLVWEKIWSGNRLVKTGHLVCRDCYDIPQQQLRAKIIGPDPLPVPNPRPENFFLADNQIILAQGNVGLGTETRVGLQVDATQPLAVFLQDNPARQYDTMELVAGAIGGYALRQFNLGYRGAAVRLLRSDGKFADIGFLNYGIDVPAAQYFAGNSPLSVVIWYDQSGWGNDLIAGNAKVAPQLLLNTPTGPALLFSGGQQLVSKLTFTQAQPITFGAVARQVVGSGLEAVLSVSGSPILLGYTGGSAVVSGSGGSVSIASPPGATHSLIGLFNGAASSITQDSVTASGSVGADSLSGNLTVGASAGGNFFNGIVNEIYAWPGALTATQSATVTRIARAVYGF